ncbi:P44/Msp2 family outer membrane protein, partial [Anaplasma phagocytophilum]|uniref:P44/Msp2 family outer membrane protein n=1 Tax=Anaplasma phagocytophilum TaxID=948 RepID=UPI000AB58B0F
AKELAYDVVNNQTNRLGDALAKVPGKDFVKFANAVVGISHPDINKKVCKTKKGKVHNPSYGQYAAKRPNDKTNDGTTSLCGGEGGIKKGGGTYPEALKEFVEKTLKEDKGEIKNWPTSRKEDGTRSETINDNAKAVAKDLVEKLTPEEKTIVAGLLAKTIEGGEVVEIRAVSSTSVMVNACCDVLSKNLRVVPYACVGLGGNFVGVVDGHSTPKLAYRLKAGLSYQLSPEISAFAGGFYHRVVGDGVYDDLPAQRLADDITLAAHTKNTAVASFVMRYFGGEFGIRFAF